MSDPILTGDNPKADARIMSDAAKHAAGKWRWYTNSGGDNAPPNVAVWVFGPVKEFQHRNGGTPSIGAINESMLVPCTYARARAILGDAWPKTWPQTDPDAPDITAPEDAVDPHAAPVEKHDDVPLVALGPDSIDRVKPAPSLDSICDSAESIGRLKACGVVLDRFGATLVDRISEIRDAALGGDRASDKCLKLCQDFHAAIMAAKRGGA